MLRITGCSNSSYWYAGKTGDVVPLLGLDRGEYLTREPGGYVNIVKVGDAEVVNVTPVDPVPACQPYREAIEIVVQFEGGPAPLTALNLKRSIEEFVAEWLLRNTRGDLVI